MKDSTFIIVALVAILFIGGAIYFLDQESKTPAGNSKTANRQNSQTGQTSPASNPSIKTGSKSEIGNYLADGNGITLYYFADDVPEQSNCSDNCAAIWPAFYASGTNISADLTADDFGVITRADGTNQTTYLGWPLYRYSQDINAGDANGQGFNGIWFAAANPFYTLLIKNNSIVGPYLADSTGRSLYVFANDTPENAASSALSNCTGVCSQNWPPYYAQTEKIITPTTINPADFAEFTRSDGQSQLAYKGFPLYYYSKDAKPGDTTGNNLNNIWHLASPSGFNTGTAAPPRRY